MNKTRQYGAVKHLNGECEAGIQGS